MNRYAIYQKQEQLKYGQLCEVRAEHESPCAYAMPGGRKIWSRGSKEYSVL